MEKTAKFVKNLKWRGDAALYAVDPPMEWSDCDEDGKSVTKTCTHVVVSAVVAMFSGPETYIFPAKEDEDRPLSWLELPGSFRGAMDHTQALENAGYKVVE